MEVSEHGVAVEDDRTVGWAQRQLTSGLNDEPPRAATAAASRIASWLPPTVAWKNGGSGLMFCDRAAP
jgi:hypothetical protein